VAYTFYMDRFWEKVVRLPVGSVNACWVWAAVKNKQGYGQFRVGRKMVLAHRFSWFLTHGKESEVCVCHRCDNPSCVRPDHLFEGSNSDNIADRVAKGRSGRGGGRPRSLSDEDIASIRNDTRPRKAVGADWGISGSYVSMIRSRRVRP
jgi:hypothetical protein